MKDRVVYLTKGLPGSGKSTWARDVMAANPGQYKRINKDDLRNMLDGGKWSRGNEKFVLRMRDQMIIEALALGKSVIVDDTNLHPKHEAHIRQLVKEVYGDAVSVEIIDSFLDTPLDVCIERDAARPNSVGETVIMNMYLRYIVKPEAPEYDIMLPDCIVCDIDGTLAIVGERDPYDASTCEQDEVNWPTVLVLDQFHDDAALVLVSGRSARYREETERWLSEYNIEYDALFMRPEDDNQRDADLKEQIYHEHIEGKYNVMFVLDDRNQTVRRWRELGLTCFQVAPGDF